ncbi:tRNA (adenosine(37)-N6)-threonylcarbamoyltransferase complex ATPase subunit type 1 TsaE [Algoriphagus sediminis]|uniref:tRNA threonylcarbamoyladenosine biosynthesis protein TsaE n=1 Tax=Algoriphagus sediminis TaxID=3057113 RepID=A0ABT7Y9H2_9BACT|nr:tRNA (adenosine(37)-N6)-threonylcarbamoyltransferase complex ATPase subunit type 1 TsaE [Algoriphagus sediminis]MDN3203167.1 tRNA (adenosine(37)-N6)-threonylcarbamoyltransferase complex ATPase subunit type 1 TsaE [Algoriphagus sediminis]
MNFDSGFSFELSQIHNLASGLIENAFEEKIWIFEGEMGAGKTTLIKALAQKLGVNSPVSSPTFGIVNEYDSESGEIIYHFDFYRIVDPAEALDIGIEEYFYSGNRCWVEWAGKVAEFLPDKFLKITLEMEGATSRKITVERINDE